MGVEQVRVETLVDTLHLIENACMMIFDLGGGFHFGMLAGKQYNIELVKTGDGDTCSIMATDRRDLVGLKSMAEITKKRKLVMDMAMLLDLEARARLLADLLHMVERLFEIRKEKATA